MRDIQVVYRECGNHFEQLALPSPRTRLVGNVCWGRHDCIFTPAYWAAQAWLHESTIETASGRIGSTLAEEIAVCLLGGHGMPAEVGLAAFASLRNHGLLDGRLVPAYTFTEALSEPLYVNGRSVRYRFVRQRAAFLADAMQKLPLITAALECPSIFRERLLEVRGIGLKTASWIVRNWLGSDDVAILDIHIFRAGLIAGIFPSDANIARDYLRLEQSFLRFANGLGIRASRLDSLIWSQMKFARNLGINSASRALRARMSPVMLVAA